MARVQLLSRRDAGVVDGIAHGVPVVALGYMTEAVPPRLVYLPRDLYREATPDELVARPAYDVYPKDDQAADAERKQIASDIEAAVQAQPETFDV